jgi:tetratricopeptide (TPR) repeat protein
VAAALTLLAFVPGAAHGQSAWARGDDAYHKHDWARAESLYARRARLPHPPAALLANYAAARAQHAPDDSVERSLLHLAARPDAAGAMSGYNLGTLLGRRGEVNQALAELRRAMERDPDDADARWNYEWLRRQQDGGSKPPSPKPDDPKPNDKQQPKAQDPRAGQGSAQSTQPPPSSSQSQSSQAQAPPAPGTQQPMTRRQAEELLGSLGDLERLEQRGKRNQGTPREKRGKDW